MGLITLGFQITRIMPQDMQASRGLNISWVIITTIVSALKSWNSCLMSYTFEPKILFKYCPVLFLLYFFVLEGFYVKDTLPGTLYTLYSLVLTTCSHMHIILMSHCHEDSCLCTFLLHSKLRLSKMEECVCTSSKNCFSYNHMMLSIKNEALPRYKQFLRCEYNLTYFKDEETSLGIRNF